MGNGRSSSGDVKAASPLALIRCLRCDACKNSALLTTWVPHIRGLNSTPCKPRAAVVSLTAGEHLGHIGVP